MEFAFGQRAVRARKRPIPDVYNPETETTGSWDDADTIELPGAFVATSSSSDTTTATRTQVVTAKSLYSTDTAADVRPGDRILADGHTYSVPAVPSADSNPFTGWQPVQEIPLEEVLG
jgi:hypothetical protein